MSSSAWANGLVSPDSPFVVEDSIPPPGGIEPWLTIRPPAAASFWLLSLSVTDRALNYRDINRTSYVRL